MSRTAITASTISIGTLSLSFFEIEVKQRAVALEVVLFGLTEICLFDGRNY